MLGASGRLCGGLSVRQATGLLGLDLGGIWNVGLECGMGEDVLFLFWVEVGWSGGWVEVIGGVIG